MSDKIGRVVYDAGRRCYLLVDGSGAELRELHPGDVLTVRYITDDPSRWFNVRIEHDDPNWWYMVTQYGHERDDFDLLDVKI